MVWIHRFSWLLLTVLALSNASTLTENPDEELLESSKNEQGDGDDADARAATTGSTTDDENSNIERDERSLFGTFVQTPSGHYISYPSHSWPAAAPLPIMPISQAPQLSSDNEATTPVDQRLVEPFQQDIPTVSPFDGRPTTLFIVGLVQNPVAPPVIQINFLPPEQPVQIVPLPVPTPLQMFPTPTSVSAPIWPPFLTSDDFMMGQPSPMIVIVPRPSVAPTPDVDITTTLPLSTTAPVTAPPTTATPTLTSVVPPPLPLLTMAPVPANPVPPTLPPFPLITSQPIPLVPPQEQTEPAPQPIPAPIAQPVAQPSPATPTVPTPPREVPTAPTTLQPFPFVTAPPMGAADQPTEAPAIEVPSALPPPTPTTQPGVPTSVAPPPVVGGVIPGGTPVADTAAPTGSPVDIATSRPTHVITAAPTQTCNQGPDLRELLIHVLLNDVSDPSLIETEGTPQYHAAQWIIHQDTRYLCPSDATLRRRYSLAVFYYATRGDRWLACKAPTADISVDEAHAACTIDPLPNSGSDAWLTEGDECQWGGVVCDDDGRVRVIDIERNGLSGTLASELQELSNLQFLILEDGVISGTIPSELGLLSELQVLDLNFNFLQGTIPDELYDVPTIRQIDLNDNELSGTLSVAMEQLQNLEFFQVQNNRLTGTIPSTFGALDRLGTASFHGNMFTGSMPAEICELRNSGVLAGLTADCDPETEVLLECSTPDCCTQCF